MLNITPRLTNKNPKKQSPLESIQTKTKQNQQIRTFHYKKNQVNTKDRNTENEGQKSYKAYKKQIAK